MKKCIRCGVYKQLTEFYKHSKMEDGHLNKCKTCSKSDAKDNYERKMQDSDFVKHERERQRKKSAKARRLGHVAKVDPEYNRNWAKKNPEKRKAHHAVSNAIRDGKLVKKPCEVCGCKEVQAHHEDYDKPLEVRWLCIKHHNEEHVRNLD